MGRAQRNPSASAQELMGFAALYPSYDCPQFPLVRRVVRLIDGELVHRGLPQMFREPRRLRDRPRLSRSCPTARGSARSASRPRRATASASPPPPHRSPAASASCRVTRSSALMPTRSLKALWPLICGVISLRRKSATALISSVGVGSSCIISPSGPAASANRFPSPTTAGRSWRAPSNDRGLCESAASCRST